MSVLRGQTATLDFHNDWTPSSGLSVCLVTQPAHGNTSATGVVITYTSNLNYAGTRHFLVLPLNGQTTSKAITVTVNVVEQPPVAYTYPYSIPVRGAAWSPMTRTAPLR